jgi:hypothetical protein
MSQLLCRIESPDPKAHVSCALAASKAGNYWGSRRPLDGHEPAEPPLQKKEGAAASKAAGYMSLQRPLDAEIVTIGQKRTMRISR